MKYSRFYLLTAVLMSTACNNVNDEQVKTGKKFYAQCVECHGSDGKLNALGKSQILQGQSKEEIERKLKAYKSGERNGIGMGAWKQGMLAQFSDTDIEALSVYISIL